MPPMRTQKSAINCLINRKNTYSITFRNKDQELKITEEILKKQSLPASNNTNTKKKQKKINQNKPPSHITTQKKKIKIYLRTQTLKQSSEALIQ
jgi:hypothetical protein